MLEVEEKAEKPMILLSFLMIILNLSLDSTIKALRLSGGRSVVPKLKLEDKEIMYEQKEKSLDLRD